MASKSFNAVKDRHSTYQLNKDAPIYDQQIIDVVNTLVTHAVP